MTRGTTKFKTANGFDVEINDYLTGGEWQKLQDMYLENLQIDLGEAGEAKMQNFNAGVESKVVEKALEFLIVSVDGDKNNVVQKVKDMPVDDYREVVEKVNTIRGGIGEEKKTK